MATKVYSQCCLTASQSGCSSSTANYFLAWLNSVPGTSTAAGGLVLTTANTTANAPNGWAICNKTWTAAGGTCCNSDGAYGMFNKTVNQIATGWQDFFKSLKKLLDVIPRIAQATANVDVQSAFQANLNSGPNSGNVGLSASKFTALQIYSILNKSNTTFTPDTLKAFKGQAKACFDATNQVRGRIWCRGCSSTGYLDFGVGPTVNVAPDSCNGLIATCGPVWSYMFNAQTVLNLAILFRNTMKLKRDPNSPNANPDGKLPSFFQGKTPSDIQSAFDACGPSFALSSTCTQDLLNTLCIGHLSFTQKEGDAGAVDSTDTGNAGNSRRLLQTDQGGLTTVIGGFNMGDTTNTGVGATPSIDASGAGSGSSFMKVMIGFFATAAVVLL